MSINRRQYELYNIYNCRTHTFLCYVFGKPKRKQHIWNQNKGAHLFLEAYENYLDRTFCLVVLFRLLNVRNDLFVVLSSNRHDAISIWLLATIDPEKSAARFNIHLEHGLRHQNNGPNMSHSFLHFLPLDHNFGYPHIICSTKLLSNEQQSTYALNFLRGHFIFFQISFLIGRKNQHCANETRNSSRKKNKKNENKTNKTFSKS